MITDHRIKNISQRLLIMCYNIKQLTATPEESGPDTKKTNFPCVGILCLRDFKGIPLFETPNLLSNKHDTHLQQLSWKYQDAGSVRSYGKLSKFPCSQITQPAISINYKLGMYPTILMPEFLPV